MAKFKIPRSYIELLILNEIKSPSGRRKSQCAKGSDAWDDKIYCCLFLKSIAVYF